MGRVVTKRGSVRMCTAGAMMMSVPAAAMGPSDFASRVVEYAPAPGQFVNNPLFNNPAAALGPPIGGGTAAANNTKVVTLGGFGGTITLGFESPVRNDSRNPLGLDAIVFGNAVWVGGNANRRFAEAATIEISRDENENGIADDTWYLIPGSHLSGSGGGVMLESMRWDDDVGDMTHGPASVDWIPPGRTGTWTTSAYRLADDPFVVGAGGVLNNPLGVSASVEGVWGYGDMSPTLILGDTDADNVVDVEPPGMEPGEFYTVPDDPIAVGIGPGFATAGGRGGGGDAFDISWAIDPATGQGPVGGPLAEFSFLRITTAAQRVGVVLGELSAEIGGAADVRAIGADPADFNDDGVVNSQDLFDFLAAFFLGEADINDDGVTNSQDLFDYLAAFFGG